MARVIFKKSKTMEPFHMKAGEWVPMTADGKLSAYIMPIGWKVFGSIHAHTIDKDGNVNPSVMLTYDDLTFHEFITLEGWD